MIPQVDILEDIEEDSDEYQYVILGTYSFDPDFFEERILPIFRYKDAETILVLSDKNEYQNRFLDMGSAGHEYYIDYCYASKVFHPKFVLLVWSEGIKLILGSANLTKRGWFESGEIVGILTHYFSEPDKQNEKILSDLRDFLSKILEKNYIKSEKHRLKLFQVLEKIPKKYADEKSNVNLIHNLERPILHQVMEVIDKPIKAVKIVAPFFNVEGSVFDFFGEKGCKDFQVFIQPDKVTGFPKEKSKEMISQGSKITVNKIAFKENENRSIHAKVMIIKTSTKSFCLYGSANPTFSGMLATPGNGNLELCVLNSSESDYDNLIENDSMVIDPITVEQIKEFSEKLDGETKPDGITIHDAHLEEKKLILETEQLLESIDIVLAHSDEEFLNIPFQTKEKRFSVNLSNEQFGFCTSPTYVQIRFQKNNQQIESNRRWISTQTLELTPRRTDIEKIQKSGRFGLISFLNKLENFVDESEWFYYYLQRIQFEDPSTLEPVRRKLVRIIRDDIENEKPPKTEPANSFKTKFEKSSNKIKKSLRQMDKLNQEEFEDQFNRFLTWGKVILWFNLRDKSYIHDLRFIRANMEEFLDLHQRIKQDRGLTSYLNENNFWQHLVLLSFLVYSFQKKAGFLRTNPGVARVFKETTVQLVEEFENEITFVKEDFDPIMKEYSEFKNLKVDLDMMSRFYEEEFTRKIF